ncbi:hypothetical protein ACLI08_03965 [Flavobacterium sp. RNTU_13]|uniref:hypothetical protein n=1 Tax=Flavobacterium sp. RNTU_13 TaxID=3375145 RepID=UPI0039880CA7
MENELQDLINESSQINFSNNCERSIHGIYSKASPSLLAWVARVENYVVTNYNSESGPYKLFQTFHKNKLNGYEEDDFNKHITILIGTLESCLKISPNKTQSKDDNVIMMLIKNYLFWTVLVVAVGASYKLGFDNGNTKFDREKIELNARNEILKLDIEKKEIIIRSKDSMIIELKSKEIKK